MCHNNRYKASCIDTCIVKSLWRYIVVSMYKWGVVSLLWACDWLCGSLGGTLIPRLHLTIATAQIRAPSQPILRRLGLQANLYCADSGSKWRHFRKMTAAILGMFWLHFSIVEESGNASSIFFFTVYASDLFYSLNCHILGLAAHF